MCQKPELIVYPHIFFSQKIVVPNCFDPNICDPKHFDPPDFGTLQFLKNIFFQISPFVGGGAPPIFSSSFFIIMGQYKFACKNSEPQVKSLWDKSKQTERKRRKRDIERERRNSLNSGHYHSATHSAHTPHGQITEGSCLFKRICNLL